MQDIKLRDLLGKTINAMDIIDGNRLILWFDDGNHAEMTAIEGVTFDDSVESKGFPLRFVGEDNKDDHIEFTGDRVDECGDLWLFIEDDIEENGETDVLFVGKNGRTFITVGDESMRLELEASSHDAGVEMIADAVRTEECSVEFHVAEISRIGSPDDFMDLVESGTYEVWYTVKRLRGDLK